MTKYWSLIILLLLASIAATTWLLVLDGAAAAVAWFWQVHAWVQANKALALLVFFIISFISQMIVMPSGSLLLLFAGFALGAAPATAAFAIAQLLTAGPVYCLSQRAITGIEQGSLKGTATEKMVYIRSQLASLKGHDFLASALLRLTPVIPSAGACLLAAVSKISLKPFMMATAVTCWMRPLFFASSGAAISEVLLRSDGREVLESLNLWPLILVFVAALLLVVFSGILKRRVSRYL